MKQATTLSPVKQAVLKQRLQKAFNQSVRGREIPKRPDPRMAPLSCAQRQMWLIDQMTPGNAAYNLPYGFRLRGPLRVQALENAFNEIIKRHEILRTTFAVEDGEPLQWIHPRLTVEIEVTALNHLGHGERENRLKALASAEAVTPFDLSRLPLIRVSLFQLSESEHVLVINLHHILADGMSMGVLMDELNEFYRASTQGGRPQLPDLPAQYGDFANWQHGKLAEDGAYARQLDFWRKQLGGSLPVLQLPGDKPRPALQSFHGANVFFQIPTSLTQDLKSLGSREGGTFFMTALAAFHVLLQRHSGSEQIVIGTPVAMRSALETKPLIGNFLNMMALDCDGSGDPSFLEMLRRVRDTALSAFSNADLPFEAIMEHLKFERDPGRNVIFQAVMQLLTVPPAKLGRLEVSSFFFNLKFAQFDLSLDLYEEPGGTTGRFEYCSDIFEEQSIRRMCEHFVNLLEAIVQDPTQKISALPMLNDSERHRILVEWNEAAAKDLEATEVSGRGALFHDLIADQAACRPEAVAVKSGSDHMTYAELDHRANQMAHALRRRGVGPDVLVGLCVNRSAEMIVALLAVMKAGGAYVPLDPDYPKERIAFILEDCGAKVLITEPSARQALPLLMRGVELLDLDHHAQDIAREPLDPPTAGVEPSHLAYAIYTSGSTGRPKAALLTHGGLANLAVSEYRLFGVGPHSRVLQFSSLSFDTSLSEIAMALCSGATLHVEPRDSVVPGPELAGYLEREKITVLSITPSALALLDADAGPSIEQVIVGGEPCPVALADRWVDRCRFFNAYGPTETTITATSIEYRGRARPPLIGRPLPNVRIYLLDGAMQPVPVGVIGEMYIGGVGVARGYLNRAELTAASFLDDPFTADPSARVYRTGDFARWRSDGQIEFVGRKDDQVKILGCRIELGEIETALARHPAIREVVVVARESGTGEKRLVAYVVAEQPAEDLAVDLRQHVAGNLPEHMVPSAFVVLDAFPLTPNGKIDRRQLPAPEQPVVSTSHVAPRTPTEEKLTGICAEVLGLDHIGADDNFFELGGNSLLAMRVVSRVRRALDLELPLREIFAAPTPSQMAARIDALKTGTDPASLSPPLEPTGETGPAEISFSQQRLWILDQIGGAAQIIEGAMELRGSLNASVMEQAIGELIARHESLRTSFAYSNGRPWQVVAEPGSWTLPKEDLRGRIEAPEEFKAILRKEASRVFDLEKGPLFRARLYRLEDELHVLLLTMHHIISDGWSMGILLRELCELYRALSKQEPVALPEPKIQYRDFAKWQRAWLRGERLANLASHWRERLAGAPQILELPTNRPRPAVARNLGAIHSFIVPQKLTEELRALSRREGATLYMTLLAGFTLLLSRYTGQKDLLVGTPVANRNRVETEEVIGFFVNTLVLRADLTGDPSASELLGRLRECSLDALAHQELPFERLVEELRPERDLSRNPLVQVMFALQNTPLAPIQLPGLTQRRLEVDPGIAQVDLTLDVQESDEGLSALFEYATDLFDEATIVRMADHWRTLLQALVDSPERHLSELPLLTADERGQLLVEWNRTETNYPRDKHIHELFEAQAARTPQAVALIFEEQRVTYQDLNEQAGALSESLRKLGVGPGARVGLCVNRSAQMVGGLLGILKTGACYVPLDPLYPLDRMAFMLQDSRASVLLTHESLRESFRSQLPDLKILSLDRTSGPGLLLSSETNLHVGADNDATPSTIHAGTPAHNTPHSDLPPSRAPAYIIYTSGSTGKPKGVVVPHQAVVNFLESMAHEPGLTEKDVLVAVTTLSFDIAVLELLLPLSVGATVVIADHEQTLDGRALAALLERHQATVMQATPVTWRLLLESDWEAERHFKALVGGESLPKDLADQLLARGVELWNMYGPTETTVWSTCTRVTDTKDGITIGRPIANTVVRILDEWKNPCPVGVAGELCLGGDGLALGYWERRELTADRFIADPYGSTPDSRLYRTGDLARWRRDGSIEHLGRLDFQVKLRGFRIELGEIETAVARHRAVREVATVVREDTPGEKRLVAYLVADQAPADLIDQVRALLRNALPEYMVPSYFILLDALPRTPNGKIDRKGLPAPSQKDGDGRRETAEPQTATEEMVLRIFRSVLGREDFGVTDNFFDLGGHSLMAARLMSRIRNESGVNLPLRDLFARPTVAGLSEAIDALEWLQKTKTSTSNDGMREEYLL